VIVDRFGRPLRNLRLSVTDRCNLRCSYCMPEEEYAWLPRGDILTFEEVKRLIDVFADLGVDKVRLTGGEPLLRRDLSRLVRMIASEPRIRDLAITTNGILLAQEARALRDAGLHRVTDRYRLPDGFVFGIISSTTAPFCSACDRSRLTADGQWLLCLYATTGLDLRKPLRDGATKDELASLIRSAWQGRRDRGAEERLLLKDRQPLVQITELKAKPHLEMHTRGG